MTIHETLIEGRKLLEAPSSSSCIDTPALDAALLLSDILRRNCLSSGSREELITLGNEYLSDQNREDFFRLVSRRLNGECAAYILGKKEFRGLTFLVTPAVLVPRPDTETLVEAALEHIDLMVQQGVKNPSLLDLCTGSGALAISLKNERPFLSITASDISREALKIAVLNATLLLQNRHPGNGTISFIESSLFDKIPRQFDIIVSNPPYVPSDEINCLAPEVRREPRLALDGGNDGLDLIRKIISQSPDHLVPGGVLLLEAAPDQMPAIRSLMEAQQFGSINVHRDLAGMDRVILAFKR